MEQYGAVRMAPLTARQLLGVVLRQARETLDRSPEQVGQAAHVSGRTIRRLEDASADMARPRNVTLDALSAFYGLRTNFVRDLAGWGKLSGAELLTQLRETAAQTLGTDVAADYANADSDMMTMLALRMARHSAPRTKPDTTGESESRRLFMSYSRGEDSWAALERAGESDDAVALLDDFLSLDRRRQRTLRDLAADLRAARERERKPSR